MIVVDEAGTIDAATFGIVDLEPVLRNCTFVNPGWEAEFASWPRWRKLAYRARVWVTWILPWRVRGAITWCADAWWESRSLCRLPWVPPYKTREQRAIDEEEVRKLQREVRLLAEALGYRSGIQMVPRAEYESLHEAMAKAPTPTFVRD